jgi:hypothetical protein
MNLKVTVEVNDYILGCPSLDDRPNPLFDPTYYRELECRMSVLDKDRNKIYNNQFIMPKEYLLADGYLDFIFRKAIIEIKDCIREEVKQNVNSRN